MQIKHVLSALLFVFTLCFFGSNAFAQAAEEGLDARVGLSGNFMSMGAEISAGPFTMSSDTELSYNGFAGKLSFGYRWEYVGVYLDQELGGVWYSDSSNEDNDDYLPSKQKKDDGHFLGGTFFVVRGILPCTEQFMLDLGFGLGVMYSDGDKADDVGKSGYKAPLIINKDGDPSAAFAIKLSFSLAYFFTDMIGAGIYFDYNYAFKTLEYSSHSYDDEYDNGYTMDLTIKYHIITPGIQLLVRF